MTNNTISDLSLSFGEGSPVKKRITPKTDNKEMIFRS